MLLLAQLIGLEETDVGLLLLTTVLGETKILLVSVKELIDKAPVLDTELLGSLSSDMPLSSTSIFSSSDLESLRRLLVSLSPSDL